MSIAIKVEGLSKQYQLGTVGTGTLSHDLNRWWALMRGKEDPSLKIGSSNTLNRVEGDFVWALQDINFEVNQGDVIGIIGRNGAGKSTLLKIMSRVTGPTKGSVKVKGRIASLLEVGTGFHPELTGRENIFLNGAILGMTKKEIHSKFDEIVDFSGVEKYLETPVKRYSSGMYVRLAFAVASHLDPEILVIDEVLAVGDLKFQAKCMDKMKDVSKTGRTIFFVSHNMGLINMLCEKSLLLEEGRLVNQGPTQDIINQYIANVIPENAEYVQASDPLKPMNLLRARILNRDSKVVSEILYHDSFSIEISYEVNKVVSGCYVGVAILTAQGINVLVTADHDLTPSLLGERNTGNYTTKVSIPCKWFNPGMYFVRVFVVDGFSSTVFDRADVVGFTIVNSGTPGSQLGEDSRKSILQPELDWETQKLG
jgi:lipopolysaccharide transport system ATP-binding protein